MSTIRHRNKGILNAKISRTWLLQWLKLRRDCDSTAGNFSASNSSRMTVARRSNRSLGAVVTTADDTYSLHMFVREQDNCEICWRISTKLDEFPVKLPATYLQNDMSARIWRCHDSTSKNIQEHNYTTEFLLYSSPHPIIFSPGAAVAVAARLLWVGLTWQSIRRGRLSRLTFFPARAIHQHSQSRIRNAFRSLHWITVIGDCIVLLPCVSKCPIFFYNVKRLEPIFIIFGTQYPENHGF